MLKSIEVLGMEIPIGRIVMIKVVSEGVTIDFREVDGGDDMRLAVPLRAVRFIHDYEKEKKSTREEMEKNFREAFERWGCPR